MYRATTTTLLVVFSLGFFSTAQANIVGGNAGDLTASNPGPPGTEINGDTSTFSVDAMSGDVTGTATAYAKRDLTFGTERKFDADFTQVASSSGVQDFVLTFKNSVGNGVEDPAQPASFMDEIGPIDIELIPKSTGAAFDESSPANGYVASTSNFANGNFFTNGFGNKVLRIGGLNGGGFAIPWGDTATIRFSINSPATIGVFTLRFAANPEPGTIALAGMAILLIGGGYTLYRRRKMMPVAGALSV